MKPIFLIVCVFMMFANRLSAQQTSIEQILKNELHETPGMPVNQVIKHIGSQVYIVDSVYSYQIISRKLMYLYLGGSRANPEITVIVKGTDRRLGIKRKKLIGGIIHLTGTAILFNNKPALVMTSHYQCGTQSTYKQQSCLAL